MYYSFEIWFYTLNLKKKMFCLGEWTLKSKCIKNDNDKIAVIYYIHLKINMIWYPYLFHHCILYTYIMFL